MGHSQIRKAFWCHFVIFGDMEANFVILTKSSGFSVSGLVNEKALDVSNRAIRIARFLKEGKRPHPQDFSLTLRPQGPGRGPENGNFQKVVRRGCKRCFGPREQRSPKSLLHHPNPVLHRCNSLLHQCKRPLAPLVRNTFCTLSQPRLGNFYFRALSQALGVASLTKKTTRFTEGQFRPY